MSSVQSEGDEVKGGTFNVTKYGVSVALAGLLAALVAGAQQFKAAEVSEPVTIAALAVVSVGLVAAALVAVADFVARAYVTAALRTAPPPAGQPSTLQSSAPARQAVSVTALPPGCLLRVMGHGDAPFIALAVQWNEPTQATRYLVTREEERPLWVSEDQVGGCIVVAGAGAGARRNGERHNGQHGATLVK